MKAKKGSVVKKSKKKSGKGIINTMINKLPFELHVPSYQYCGPGTKLKKRLNRNDPGINELDKACKAHDIAYDNTNNVDERNRADNILAKKAWQRFKSKNASIKERAVALGVSGVMKAKAKMGLGVKKRKQSKPQKSSTKAKCKRGSGIKLQKRKTPIKKKQTSVPQIFRAAIKTAKDEIKKQSPQTVSQAAKLATQAAKIVVKNHKIPRAIIKKNMPRVIPVPKIGGLLPLIPIFAGLSALGALMGGSASVANAVVSANNAKKKLKEAHRHNETIESIALGHNSKTGGGLHLGQHKKGFGLYLSPYSKNE